MFTHVQAYALTTEQQQAVQGGKGVGFNPVSRIDQLNIPSTVPQTAVPKPQVCGTGIPLPTDQPVSNPFSKLATFFRSTKTI